MPISFGDNVRIASTSETIARGFAGQTGSVYGMTTPSATGVEVIGRLTEDYAINVHFDDRGESHWFTPDLVEFIDHGAGTELSIGDSHYVRSTDGEWIANQSASVGSKPWWRFW
jgi:hypothetical protein